MFQDICFPKGNEKEFEDMAKKLGTQSLIFAYDFTGLKDFEQKKKNINDIIGLRADIGIVLDEKNLINIPELDAYIFSKSPSRQIVESRKSHILYDFETALRPDFLHHRNSGLNDVLCNAIKEKGKILGFSFSTLLNSKNPGQMLGRMQQNARFARKYKLKTVVASFAGNPFELRSKAEIESFKRILGL